MTDCIFCKIGSGEIPSYKIYEDIKTFVFLDLKPASDYHTLIIPKNHSTNVFDISEDDLCAIASTLKKITTMYREKLGIENVQVINNSGASAQQVVFHTHWHIVPRYKDDGKDIHFPNTTPTPDYFEKLLGRLK